MYILQRAIVFLLWQLSFAECKRPILSLTAGSPFLGFLGLRSGCWSTLSVGVYLVVEAKQSSAHGPKVEKLAAPSSPHTLPLPVVLPPQGRGDLVHHFAPSWPSSTGSSGQVIYTFMSLQLPSARSPQSLQTTFFPRSTLSSSCLKIRRDADQGRTIDRKCQRSKVEY